MFARVVSVGIDFLIIVDSNFLFGTSNFLFLLIFGLALLSNLDFDWLNFDRNACFSLISSASIHGLGE